ncbi:condensin complex subunit 2-like isoform X1 [Triticum dicoccoides]|uniref:condensin complex subunit 2-like isoform X1 n=1 Tax=Triticum dicoccoides TaxID=85692 RepID=UPI00188EAE8B|nr:condensin complex subunit 2-like isoform X1 [Triticum dicoccoides]
MPPAEDASAAAPPQAPTPPRARGMAVGSRLLLQSPPPAFPLGSNDDQLERARARAMARAASVRRRSLAASLAPKTPHPNLLNRDEVMDLFHNCIKLASENVPASPTVKTLHRSWILLSFFSSSLSVEIWQKINQKNTWELGLIDHLSEIIHAGEEEDDETNFQKASCTLEAGVKIYSLRVDSVHSEAYKVLGAINRAGRGEEADLGEGGDAEPAQEEGVNKKDDDRRISPASTLESSFEALNVKKFDAAFTVDPLYHQTTAQFDEGGAKGLLLYNLGVYGSCCVLFDSFEAPDKCILSDPEKAEVIDLSFAKEQIEQMIVHMPLSNDISPTLRDIVAQFDEENKRPSHDASSGQMLVMEDQVVDSNDDSMPPDCGTWDFGGCDDQDSAYDENCNPMNFNSTNYEEGTDDYEYTFQGPDGPDVDERLEKIADLLSLGAGFSSKTNAWAGPEHWKYRKVRDLEPAQTSSGDLEVAKKSKKKKGKQEPDIDFTKALEHEKANVFAPPKNPKSLLLPANKGSCNNKLPEDCHYQPESLVKLFLLPDILCLAQRRRKPLDDSRDNSDDFMPSRPWDNDDLGNDHVDEGDAASDVEEPVDLIAKPRQVNKIDVQYDKVSKQVDVHALKELLCNHIHTSAKTADLERDGIEPSLCLTKVLHDLPCSNRDVSTTEISPHLYFICLLHLANEHSLTLRDRPTLDEVDIYILISPLVK